MGGLTQIAMVYHLKILIMSREDFHSVFNLCTSIWTKIQRVITLLYCICLNFIANSQQMRNLEFEKNQTNQELLSFFSSYLRDILNIAKQIKSHTYFLIGVQPGPHQHLTAHPNIYSIMEACNQSFETLRRTETLLRGHVRGRLEVEKEKTSVKGSRLSVRNQFRANKPTSLSRQVQGDHFDYLTYLRLTRNDDREITQRDKKQEFKVKDRQEYQQIQNRLIQKKGLYESKSHGHLLNQRQAPPPSEASRFSGATCGSRNSLGIINKIREQLGFGST